MRKAARGFGVEIRRCCGFKCSAARTTASRRCYCCTRAEVRGGRRPLPASLALAQLLYEQLRHMDICHFVILECRHLANGCVLKCGCIGLMLFRNLSCLGTIICYINTIGIVPAYACNICDALVASYATTG